MNHRTLLMLALLTTGCGRYDIDPGHYTEEVGLWDPQSALPTDAGLFVRLTRAGDVALLTPGKDTVRVHLDDAEIDSIEAGAGGDMIMIRDLLVKYGIPAKTVNAGTVDEILSAFDKCYATENPTRRFWQAVMTPPA